MFPLDVMHRGSPIYRGGEANFLKEDPNGGGDNFKVGGLT